MSVETEIDRLRACIARVPRYPLAHLPTPFEHLATLSRVLGGPQIYIKRDDCTGLAFGGNKTRHNEYLLADALQKGAEMFVWGAGVQSNNCRQTAAACAKAGLDCKLVLSRATETTDNPPLQGNYLLDHLMGADVKIVDAPVGTVLDEEILATAQEHRARGRNVYFWAPETVKPLAAISYVSCMIELAEQAAQQNIVPDAVYVSSAGSTGAGLTLAASALKLPTQICNICPLQWEWDTQTDMAQIANQAAQLMHLDTRLPDDQINHTFDHIGSGYGQPSPQGLEAIALLARTEGILLDPVYSGKAMAGLIDHIRTGKLTSDQNVVFLHTGGTPALFAFNQQLAQGIAPRKLDEPAQKIPEK